MRQEHGIRKESRFLAKVLRILGAKFTPAKQTYCQQNNLTMASFHYWRIRLKRSTPDKKLIPVTLSTCASTVNLYFPTGIRLEVPTPAPAEVLPLVHRFLQDQN